MMGNVLFVVLGVGAIVGGVARFIDARRQGQIPWTVWGMLITGLVVLAFGLTFLIQKLT